MKIDDDEKNQSLNVVTLNMHDEYEKIMKLDIQAQREQNGYINVFDCSKSKKKNYD